MNRHWGELMPVVCFKGSLLAAEGSPFDNGLIIEDSRCKYSSRMLFQTCYDSNPWYLNWKLTCVTSSLPNAGKFCLLVLWKSLTLECENVLIHGGTWEESLALNGPNASGVPVADSEPLWSWAEHVWMYCNCWNCIYANGSLVWRPLVIWSLSIGVYVCKAWQNWCQAFGNSLFLYWGSVAWGDLQLT